MATCFALPRKGICAGSLLDLGSVFALIAWTLPCLADPPRVIDMRAPGPGVGVIAYDTESSTIPTLCFVGDVDGDGRDDMMLNQPSRSLDRGIDPVLVFGEPAARFEMEVLIGDLRTVRFPSREGFEPSAAPFSGVGDVDADGYDDLLVTFAHAAWQGVTQSGVVFLVYGSPSYPTEVDLASPAPGVRHARFVTDRPGHFLGWTSGSAGDLNGDGTPDLAFSSASAPGTENGGEGAGRVYVVYGGPHLSGDVEVEKIGSDVPGVVLQGAYGTTPLHPYSDGLGCCSKGAIYPPGDVNGDGRDDLVVMGAESFDGAGAVYLVLGATSLPSDMRAANPGGPLVEIRGVGRGFLGFSTGSGDVDGDGLKDLVFGAPEGDGGGSSYIVYGMRDWPATISLDDPALRILRFDAAPPPSRVYPPQGLETGVSIGDWDGDGFADVIFGGWSLSVRFGTTSGKAYLVHGGPDLPRSASEVDVTSGSLRGMVMLGRDSHSWFGADIEPGGDFDGDGKEDFLAASRYFNPVARPLPADKSLVYIFFGGGRAGEQFSATRLLPSDGTMLGGEEVVILGTAFQGDEEVSFGGTPAQEVRFVSTAEIRARTPPRAVKGPVDVEVKGTAGSATLVRAFTYEDYEPLEDLILDPLWLAGSGYRSLVYRSSDVTAYGLQAASVFVHDVNGDRLGDLVVGTPSGTPEGSRVAVLLGRTSPFPLEISPVELSAFGFVIDGSRSDGNFASYVAFPGDLDGDGHDDMALGSYILFGREEWPSTLNLMEEVQMGSAVSLPSDTCEVRVAAPGLIEEGSRTTTVLESHECSGRVNLFLDGLGHGMGSAEPSVIITGDPDPVVLPRSPGGSETPRRFGTELSDAGDVNEDGLPDFVVGASHLFGAYYFILGGPFDFRSASVRELQDVGKAVFLHHNEASSCFCAWSGTASALGDFNGDGIDDVALGAPGGGRDFQGMIFVVFGSRALGTSIREMSLLTAPPDQVLRIEGEDPYNWTGYPEALGDFNGDGIADMGISSEGHRNTLPRAYVIFGVREQIEKIELSHLHGRGFRVLGKEGHTFSSRNGGIGAGDLDGDGHLDLALGEIVPDGQDFRKQVVMIFGGRGASGRTFTRGEANGDAIVNLTDAVLILEHLFRGGPAPACLDAADTDDTGELNVTDGVYLLRHLFQGTEAPPAPYPDPGPDPTADGLDC